MSKDYPIGASIRRTCFNFYTSEEILDISVKEVTSHLAFDNMGNTLSGGLYDPALGAVARDELCSTCSLSSRDCPGHFGHITFALPIYHPILFKEMVKIVKVKCLRCHSFLLSAFQVKLLALKLALLDCGEYMRAFQLDSEVTRVLVRREQEMRDDGMDGEAIQLTEQMKLRCLQDLVQAQDMVEREGYVLKYHEREYREDLIDDFIKTLGRLKKCENCGLPRHRVRDSGFCRVFVKAKSKQKSALKTIHISQREEEEEYVSESDDDFFDDDVKEEYITPLETYAQLKLLWKKEIEVVSLIWGKGTYPDFSYGDLFKDQMILKRMLKSFEIFFMKYILVPPSRFRPPNRLTGMLTEHSQNHHLSSAIKLNERLITLKQKEKIVNNGTILDNDEDGDSTEGSSDDESSDDESSDDSGLMITNKNKKNNNKNNNNNKKKKINPIIISTWIQLQESINIFIDSEKDTKTFGRKAPGIKQILEKKEGLFRKNMMGKRVNYACRSVISPDPYIGTSEIGIPLRFAKVLTYREPVNDLNIKEMRKLVERGADNYPGARYVEDNGKLIDLSLLDARKRSGLAKRLISAPGKKVWRHLKNGDPLLVNRQPTLHKPGIMAHFARILTNQQTIRMHYANCNTYNADFDGDEINCHFPQDDISRAEAHYIASTNYQYIAPTNGEPLRGLIQDHVDSAVKLTSKECFMNKEQFMGLVYTSLSALPGLEAIPHDQLIQIEPPTILKPKLLWSGKQVVSCVLKHLTKGLPPLSMQGKAKTSSRSFGEEHEEHLILIKNNELLRGVLDKASIGAANKGFIHSVYELYGPETTGKLLSVLGRLFTANLQYFGHTCGIEDLTLRNEVEVRRVKDIKRMIKIGRIATKEFLKANGLPKVNDIDELENSLPPLTNSEIIEVQEKTGELLSGEDGEKMSARLDSYMQDILGQCAGLVIKTCLPFGLEKLFPYNNFSLMTGTGAKGSLVNQSQISCGLGQQALEGRRVPLMVNGKSLPSFSSYDPNPRANGYISDRFLTGVRPQEYFFHCMAGREGLVDTAVKTSRSGYLQRCLMKHLETLKVAYDLSVRDSEGNVVQFIYGEDGLDPLHASYLTGDSSDMSFFDKNMNILSNRYNKKNMNIDSDEEMRINNLKEKIRELNHNKQVNMPSKGDIVLGRKKKDEAFEWEKDNINFKKWHKVKIIKKHQNDNDEIFYDIKYIGNDQKYKNVPYTIKTDISHILLFKNTPLDPVLSKFHIGKTFGAISEKLEESARDYIKKKHTQEESNEFMNVLYNKYMTSLISPGESVGCIAAQSIGEPSTQMTLNTFHLAGHGGANVTLGIPRLREIIMTAAKQPKTPSMIIPLKKGMTLKDGFNLARLMSETTLFELLDNEKSVHVVESFFDMGEKWNRRYQITLNFFPFDMIEKAFHISFEKIIEIIVKPFFSELGRIIKKELGIRGKHVPWIINDQMNDSNYDNNDIYETEMDITGKATININHINSSDNSDDDNDINTNRDIEASDSDSDESDDDDEEDQGTLKFGKKSDVVEYDDSDEESQFQVDRTGNKISQQNQSQVDHNSLFDTDSDSDSSSDSDSDSDSDDQTSKTNQHKNRMNIERSSSRNSDYTDTLDTALISNKFYHFVDNFVDTKNNSITFSFGLPLSKKRLLMVEIIELCAKKTLAVSLPGIKRVFAIEKEIGGEKIPVLMAEGSNFSSIFDFDKDYFQLNRLDSNDIWATAQVYGVEAARAAIIKEIRNVFGVYGISVDRRHLSLIADYMTFSGGYLAMNRGGLKYSASPFLQMSFETTNSFLTKAALYGKKDDMKTHSANLSVGQVVQGGTGSFELLCPINI